MATNKREHSGSRSFLQRVRLHATLKLLAAFVLISSLIGYVMFQSFFRQYRLEPVQATIRASRLDPSPDGMFAVDIRFAYAYAFSLGVGMAIGMYAVAQWKQKKKESHSEQDDLSAHGGDHAR